MPLSNPTIRRYTPPTCTLEVLAQSSPLSRWMGKSVLTELRFNLSFDDPRLSEDQKIVIQGNREQLEALCVALTNYVQEILQSSPESFWLRSARAYTDGNVSPDVEDHLTPDQPFHNASVPSDIYLQPCSHLGHELKLGSLANQSSGPVVRLSLLQLFDLATAIDEYTADVVAIPSTATTPRSTTIPTWAPVAAVLLVGLGLVPVTWEYANRARQQRTASTIAPADGEELAMETPLPLSTIAPPLPLPTPLNGLPSASPTIPGLPSDSFTASVPNPTATTPVQVPAVPNPPSSTFPSADTSLPITKTPLPSLGSQLTIPTNPGRSVPNLTNKNSVANSTSAISPPRKNDSAISRTLNSPVPSNAPSPKPSTPSVATTSNGGINPSQQNSTANSEVSSDELIARIRGDRASTAQNNVANNKVATGNALFSTQQVTEARQYLAGRWQPPQGLKDSLQYSLTIGVDGSLEQILPLGKASRDYIDKAGIPEIGKPFVSPNRNGQNTLIRAVLQPNGKVQTFVEEP